MKIAILRALACCRILSNGAINAQIVVECHYSSAQQISGSLDAGKCHFEEARNRDFGSSVQVPTNWLFRCFALLIAILAYKTSFYRILTTKYEFRGPSLPRKHHRCMISKINVCQNFFWQLAKSDFLKSRFWPIFKWPFRAYNSISANNS